MATGTGNLPNPSMSFSPFAILTAEELNDMVDNIESLADGTGIGDGSIGTSDIANSAVTFSKTSGIWWEEIGRTTLGVAGDTITVSSLPARKYLLFIVSTIATGGTANTAIRFNNDSGNNYGRMRSVDFASGSSAVSQSSIGVGGTNADVLLMTVNVLNIENREKAVAASASQTGGTGAATAPQSLEVKGKWANTSAQINRIDIINTAGTGDFAIGSEIVVLGHN